MLQYSLFIYEICSYIVCMRYLILIEINLNKQNCLLKVDRVSTVYFYLLLAIFHFILSYGVLLFCQEVFHFLVVFTYPSTVHIIYEHCTVLVYMFVMKNKNEKTSCLNKFSFIAGVVDNGAWQTFKFEYIHKFFVYIQNGVYRVFRAIWKLNCEKRKLKISCQTPFKF
jgi:hypothetical protein